MHDIMVVAETLPRGRRTLADLAHAKAGMTSRELVHALTDAGVSVVRTNRARTIVQAPDTGVTASFAARSVLPSNGVRNVARQLLRPCV